MTWNETPRADVKPYDMVRLMGWDNSNREFMVLAVSPERLEVIEVTEGITGVQPRVFCGDATVLVAQRTVVA